MNKSFFLGEIKKRPIKSLLETRLAWCVLSKYHTKESIHLTIGALRCGDATPCSIPEMCVVGS